jgi:hypothetical protein
MDIMNDELDKYLEDEELMDLDIFDDFEHESLNDFLNKQKSNGK